MSTASRSSVGPSRRLKNSSRESGRPRAHSRSRSRAHHVVEHDEARSFALRTAFLHYLLQPRAKRKQYVSAPAQKAPARSYTSVGQLVQEYVSGSSTTLKLPHNFAQVMLDRLGGILRGIEPLPGFKDAAVKRSFAEAYTAFSEKNFRKTMDKERKFEPLVLIFYSSATKAAQKGCAPDDDSWKLLPDRHLALFVRLSASVLKETGHERDRPELMSRLTTLENKLLTNDQDLVGGSGGDAGGTTIEVTVPLSYEVKDMPMVQVVASIFGQTLSEVQSEINEKRNVWTAEAAVRDLKTYQTRLSSDGSGALSSQDFDLDNAFDEWKRAEAPHLSQMLLDILTANPELAKSSNSHLTQSRPQSFYGEDQMYADLSRAISNDDPSSILDPASGLASLALSDVGSIRSVDAGLYTFIPPDPRAYYKYILHHAMAHDQLHADPNADHYQPLSRPSMDLMTELCVCWRISQSTRLVTLLEVAAKKFMDQEILPEELEATLDIIKTPQPEPKKPPHIQQYNIPLTDIPCSRWTMKDFSGYRNTLQSLYDSLLRELYGEMLKSYETDAPKIGPIMTILENHISSDQNFAAKPEAVADFAEHLEQALRQNANDVYRRQMQKIIPAYKEEWDFLHVVKLGKTVTKLCDKLRKRFKTCPEIFSVRPLPILVQEVLPSFENDAGAIIDTILAHAAQNELELTIEDGFELYREMVEIRRIHQEALPDRKFTFNLEDRLVDFVWRWVGSVEQKMDEFVEQAIKQDQFQVRADSGDQVVPDVNRHSVSVIDLFMLFNQSVNQVHQLSWANHVHHARFMNALARAFSAGIGKYCDTLEQRFVREMDRPSADEVIAKGRTTQEKWMQYAKDALTTKEKAEPFQFYAESFVKLNNIEYAMQALDKMEKSMNVDGCAAAIERADGPKRNVKKPSKYTFTIKVVEAEDLKACDSNGFSDPYVVFGDEYQKRLHKTRIINKNLNPRWDESFDVTVQGPVHMIATIWDYDTIGDHDYVGRTSLRLDPGQFSDYLPREFWLDLDTQGRLLIRASMEGERDDIQFHFGKAFRHLKRTERDMVRKITDKLTSEINATLSRHTLRALLGTSGISASVTNLWKKRAGQTQTVSNPNDAGNALASLFAYFDDNFAIMKETLTDATMIAVMTRLWKEVLMTVENLLVPPVSDKPSNQRPLSRQELDIVYQWLDLLFGFFNARDEQSGEQLGVPAEVLKSPKWHDLASLNFFYFEDSNSLIQESERMATATAQRAKDALLQHNQHTTVAPPSAALGANLGGAGAFASMGTIRRGKSIMMSRNLGTMRKAKEAKRRDTQADPSDDMILRILRMRPEAAHYLRDRHRQKERQAATAAAALIVRNSVAAGRGPAGSSAAQFGRNLVPRR